MKTDLETLIAILDKANIAYKRYGSDIELDGPIFLEFDAGDNSLKKIWTPEPPYPL